MKKNNLKRLGVFLLACFASVLLCWGIRFLLDAPYRKKLPDYTTINPPSKPIAEQLATATSEARLFTTADRLGRLGMAYYSIGNYAKAKECYELAIAKNNNKWLWNYYLGYAHLEQGELEAARRHFNQVTEKDPTVATAFYYAGEACQKLGLTVEAEKNFTRTIGLQKLNPDEINPLRETSFPLEIFARFQLARNYLSIARLDSAEKILQEILQQQLSFGPAYRLLGNVYAARGDSLLSAKYADCANDLADYAPPVSGLVDAIALISRSDEYLLKQIDNAVRSGNDQWALALCNQAMKYYPANKELVSHVFFIYLRMGNKEKVLAYLPQHFTLFQLEARELMDAMDFLYSSGLYNEALQYFNQARKLLPKNSSLVTWLYDRGKKQEAINMLTELVKKNPKDEKILSDLVRVILDVGDEELAQQYFSRLTAVAPGSYETLQVKGLFAERSGNAPAALAAYEQAYLAGATDLVSMKELAKTAARNQLWPKAIEYFNRALKKYPNDPELLDRMGKLLVGCPDTTCRNVPEGLAYLVRTFVHVNSADKTRLATGKMIAALYISLGDKKKAALFINRTIDLAKKQQQSEEYIAYFQTLVSKK